MKLIDHKYRTALYLGAAKHVEDEGWWSGIYQVVLFGKSFKGTWTLGRDDEMGWGAHFLIGDGHVYDLDGKWGVNAHSPYFYISFHKEEDDPEKELRHPQKRYGWNDLIGFHWGDDLE